jgi:hypothetical protein
MNKVNITYNQPINYRIYMLIITSSQNIIHFDQVVKKICDTLFKNRFILTGAL